LEQSHERIGNWNDVIDWGENSHSVFGKALLFRVYTVSLLRDRVSITQKDNSFAKPAGTSLKIQKYS
jgi:hypothetical protein